MKLTPRSVSDWSLQLIAGSWLSTRSLLRAAVALFTAMRCSRLKSGQRRIQRAHIHRTLADAVLGQHLRGCRRHRPAQRVQRRLALPPPSTPPAPAPPRPASPPARPRAGSAPRSPRSSPPRRRARACRSSSQLSVFSSSAVAASSRSSHLPASSVFHAVSFLFAVRCPSQDRALHPRLLLDRKRCSLQPARASLYCQLTC